MENYSNYVSCGFENFWVDTRLCKLRDTPAARLLVVSCHASSLVMALLKVFNCAKNCSSEKEKSGTVFNQSRFLREVRGIIFGCILCRSMHRGERQETGVREGGRKGRKEAAADWFKCGW